MNIQPGRQLGRDISPQQKLYRAGLWFKATLGRSEEAAAICAREGIALKAQGEGINAAGAFLVPVEFADTMISNRAKVGVVRRFGSVRGMASDVCSFPKRVSGPTWSFTAENGAIAENTAAFGSVTADAKKAAIFFRVSSEMMEDSPSELGAYVTEEGGWQLADAEDSCGFAGDGSATYGKMLGLGPLLADGSHAGGVVAGAGHDSLSKIDTADIEKLVSALPEQYLESACFYCSSVGLAALVRLGATAAGLIDTPFGPRPFMHYGSFPIVTTPKLAGNGSQTGKPILLFGDLRSAMMLASRREIRIAASPNRYLELDQVAFRVTSRFSTVCHNIGNASTPGAMVALLGA